ncbi:unnamed protein product [Urochloa humidicola]
MDPDCDGFDDLAEFVAFRCGGGGGARRGSRRTTTRRSRLSSRVGSGRASASPHFLQIRSAGPLLPSPRSLASTSTTTSWVGPGDAASQIRRRGEQTVPRLLGERLVDTTGASSATAARAACRLASLVPDCLSYVSLWSMDKTPSTIFSMGTPNWWSRNHR